MKKILASKVAQKDISEAIMVVTEGDYCTIYYAGDTLPAPPAPTIEDSNAIALVAFDGFLMDYYDSVAQQKGYRDAAMCMIRAGIEGSAFQAEGQAFGKWVDDCNVFGYRRIEDVKAGRKPMPTKEEYLAELPPMVWPHIAA